MILHIDIDSRIRHHRELNAYYRLRKHVFCDQLGWVTPDANGFERDHLDEIYNVVILSLDDETGDVAGGVRLSPTVGPTLMHSVWGDMLPYPDAYRAPDIWEATRFCVDDRSNGTRKRNFVNRATLALSLGVLEFCDANGITKVIGVCESKFFDMQRVYGTDPHIIASKTDENGVEIGCALWDTGPQARASLQWARPFIGAGLPPVIPAIVATTRQKARIA